jgi:hypothetical protein
LVGFVAVALGPARVLLHVVIDIARVGTETPAHPNC